MIRFLIVIIIVHLPHHLSFLLYGRQPGAAFASSGTRVACGVCVASGVAVGITRVAVALVSGVLVFVGNGVSVGRIVAVGITAVAVQVGCAVLVDGNVGVANGSGTRSYTRYSHPAHRTTNRIRIITYIIS